jgi:hypothetical protein
LNGTLADESIKDDEAAVTGNNGVGEIRMSMIAVQAVDIGS